MLDYPGSGWDDLLRYSTKNEMGQRLDATRDLGSPPSARYEHGMVSVGSDFYVFGGFRGFQQTEYETYGDEGLCDDGHRLGGACQIERLGDAPRAAAVLVATPCARAECHAVPRQGLVTLDGTSPLS